jgi:hypothetical protein
MRDLCRCELGQEVIGALSFSWGSAQVKDDVGAKFEVGLRELPNQHKLRFRPNPVQSLSLVVKG